MKKIPEQLDCIADVVLAYRPKPKTKAAKRRKARDARQARKASQTVAPLTIDQANAMVGDWYRHHKTVPGMRCISP